MSVYYWYYKLLLYKMEENNVHRLYVLNRNRGDPVETHWLEFNLPRCDVIEEKGRGQSRSDLSGLNKGTGFYENGDLKLYFFTSSCQPQLFPLFNIEKIQLNIEILEETEHSTLQQTLYCCVA